MRRTLIVSVMLPLLALAMTSCQTRETATTGNEVCLIWRGVDYSATDDSAETVAAIRALNARRDAYCK